MKPLFGLITSLITAILIIIMAQMIREGLYPQPSELYLTSNDAMSKWFNNLPDKAFIIIGISHGLAAFAAGLISSLVSGTSRMTYGMISISIIFIAVMIYLFSYYFPAWFVIADTIVTAILGFTGVLIGSARYVS